MLVYASLLVVLRAMLLLVRHKVSHQTACEGNGAIVFSQTLSHNACNGNGQSVLTKIKPHNWQVSCEEGKRSHRFSTLDFTSSASNSNIPINHGHFARSAFRSIFECAFDSLILCGDGRV